MAKILIFNATPLAMETRLREAGSPSYEELLQGSIGRHFTRGPGAYRRSALVGGCN